MSTDTDHINHTCKYCDAKTRENVVNMCLWEGERLIVIEGLPARVCGECLEQYYDNDVLVRIDQLRAKSFPVEQAKRVMEVPVFSLPADLPADELPDPEKNKDWRSRLDYDLISDVF